jgi:hypothetical protein
MSAYQHAPATPWWRIFRAWITGSLSRIPGAQVARDTVRRRRRLALLKQRNDLAGKPPATRIPRNAE